MVHQSVTNISKREKRHGRPYRSNQDASGKYTLNFYRQSGNHHRTVEVYGSRNEVESEIFKVFKRAGIDDQYMVFSPSNGIDYRRAYHNHRGANEGKKVGGCLVTAS